MPAEKLRKWAETKNLLAFCKKHGFGYSTLKSWLGGTLPTEETFRRFADALIAEEQETKAVIKTLGENTWNHWKK